MNKTILVIDDDEIILDFIKSHFKDSVYTVLATASVKRACQLLIDERIDLVLADKTMPDSDGIDSLIMLKKGGHLQNIPVIIMSADHSGSPIVESIKHGATDYISKPLNLDQLEIQIHNTLSATIKKRILLIDDDLVTQALFKAHLQKEDYSVYTFGHDQDALAELPLIKPNLILLDLLLSDEVGVDILKKIKSESDTRHIPVIVISALRAQKMVCTAFELGALDYLVKPITGPSLISHISRLI